MNAMTGIKGYRLAREQNAFAALGIAVTHLMTKPAFAGTPFGHLARVLTGQINRNDYFMVLQGAKIVGFVGWARTTEDVAEAWLAGDRAVGDADIARNKAEGDCILLNVWQADDEAVSRFIMRGLQGEFAGARMLYAKRRYADGRDRPVRLSIAHRAPPIPQDAAEARPA